MARDLTNRTIVITGASSGIGAATAVACAEAGMDVVLAGRREQKLREVARRVETAGRRALVVVCDVQVDEDVERLFADADAAFGRIDAVFANAGYGLFAAVDETTDEQMRAIFETNFFGTLRCIRAAVPRMRANGPGAGGMAGHLIICSSSVSELALPMMGAYCATKAAQDSIAQAMRAELADEGIVVTSLHPIGTRSEFFDAARDRGEGETGFNTPDTFMQTTEHVARKVVKCLRRPKAEVWPHTFTRFGMAVLTALPQLGARVLRRMMRKMREEAEGTGKKTAEASG